MAAAFLGHLPLRAHSHRRHDAERDPAPAGGATALIAVTGGEQIRQLGFWYAVVPCLAGAALMLAVAWAMTAVVYRWGSLHGRVIVEEDISALHILPERENARPVRQDAGCRMA